MSAVQVAPAIDNAARMADEALRTLRRAAAGLGWAPTTPAADGAALLAMRSTFTGRHPAGPVSAGGSARLLEVADGWIAVNLPRPDDLDLLPAWLEQPVAVTEGIVPWEPLARAVSTRPATVVVERAQLLGLAVAMVARGSDEPDEQLDARDTLDPARPFRRTRVTGAGADGNDHDPRRRLRVVDLSSLWAGPLCARLLADLGADVVKVESTTRPDGARRGHPGFYDWLHAGQRSVALPLTTSAGIAALRRRLAWADVVIEGSGPRALDAMGIDPTAVVAARPGAVWLSITAYGRTGPWRNRVGFGDDAAAGGGLVAWDGDRRPAFVGDAVADPLTGVLGAALVVQAIADGGGIVVDVGLREVARAAALDLGLVP